jgi:hypothetical protein
MAGKSKAPSKEEKDPTISVPVKAWVAEYLEEDAGKNFRSLRQHAAKLLTEHVEAAKAAAKTPHQAAA